MDSLPVGQLGRMGQRLQEPKQHQVVQAEKQVDQGQQEMKLIVVRKIL